MWISLATFPDWAIPWAGIGALCLGVGSLLSGYAAVLTAKNAIKIGKGRDNEEHIESGGAGGIRVIDGGGSGISGSGSSE